MLSVLLICSYMGVHSLMHIWSFGMCIAGKMAQDVEIV